MSRPSQSSSNGPPTSSLRPRNKRLISGLDDPAEDTVQHHKLTAANNSNVVTSFVPTPLDSPFNSRVPSPIPSTHPSRSPSHARSNFFSGSPSGRSGDQLGSDLTNQLSGLWGKSWTSLQGLASNVLGSDMTDDIYKDKSPARNRRPFEATHGKMQQWGPSSREQSVPGIGSKEERRALVRERKRQELLMSTADPSMDPLRVKRRTSDDFESTSAPPGENEDRDIMVYIHHIVTTDTLAGISVRYGCPMPILKKANRMYSDVVQTRKSILVPVDACTIKGRRCQAPPESTYESPRFDGCATNEDKTPKPVQQGFGETAFRGAVTSSPRSPGSARLTSGTISSPVSSQRDEDEKPWRHDSWVFLDEQQTPTEIARMSRRDLGFFPRARRKSVSYSDLDTPSASFDLPRPSITVSDTASARAMTSQHRKRGSSGSAKGAAGLSWASQMSGPGGVGNLRGKGESAPGPAQDKFTRAVSKHLPSMAPPQEDVFPEEDEEAYSPGGVTPLEQLGGHIEGWMRGVGKKINDAYKNQQGPGSGLTVPNMPGIKRTNSRTKQNVDGAALGLGPTTGGDLIELSNAFEIGEEDVDKDDRYDADERRGRARLSEGRDASAHRVGRDFWDESSKRKGD